MHVPMVYSLVSRCTCTHVAFSRTVGAVSVSMCMHMCCTCEYYLANFPRVSCPLCNTHFCTVYIHLYVLRGHNLDIFVYCCLSLLGHVLVIISFNIQIVNVNYNLSNL